MAIFRHRLWILAIVLCWTAHLAAETVEVRGAVKYISKSAIYIDLGRSDGIEVGNTGEIIRNGETIGNLEVLFIADRTASCKLQNPTSDPLVGDEVNFTVETSPEEIEADSIETVPVISATRTVSQLIDRTRRERIDHVSGRIGLQYYSQNDVGEYNYDYRQPSASVRLNIDNIRGSHIDLSVKLRTRKTIRQHELSEATNTRWNNRIYELSLRYNKSNSAVSYAMGRMQAGAVSGVGYFDGLMAGYKLSRDYSVGVFGGTEPDYETSDFNPDNTKFGAFVNLDLKTDNQQRLNSTLALAGIYANGEIDREFIYLRNTYSSGALWSLYQSADLGINRGWRKESSGQTFDLSSLMLSVRYNPVKAISINAGYDNRKTVRDYDNRSLADSLFDDAVREGFRAGINARLPYDLRLSFGGNIRGKASGANTSKSLNGGLNYFERSFSRIRTDLRTSWYSNLYSEGKRMSVAVSRYLFRNIDLQAETGRSEYTISDVDRKVANNWYKLDLNTSLTRSIYLSGYYEFETGDGSKTHNWLADLGVRF